MCIRDSPQLAQFFQKLEILHIPGPYLDDVHILEEGEMSGAHDLRHDGEAGVLAGFSEQFQSAGVEALERVGRSPGLEGAAPKELSSGSLYPLGHITDLLFCFHRAGARHDTEVSVADLLPAGKSDDGVVRMEFAVGLFIGLLDAFDAFHHILGGNILDIDHRSIPDQPENGAVSSHPCVDFYLIFLRQGVCEIFYLSSCAVRF